MEKTIKIGKKEVRLSNNFSWAMIYRDQFGHDILSTLTPMVAAALDVASGFLNEISTDGKVEIEDIVSALDGDKFIDAVVHMSGFETVEIAYITWAMAKACNDDIADPKTWIRDFDVFPLDTVVPEVFSLALKGLASSKNLKWLKDRLKKIKVVQPKSTPIQSSSPDSNEG